MLYETQNERVEDLNEAIYTRSLPDKPLEPLYDIRPVPTKYALFPVLNRRFQQEQPLLQYPPFSTENVYTPPVGNMGPLSGFSIDKETQLQNRFFAKQKHGTGIQTEYIPSSNSNLYNDPVFSSSTDSIPQQQHPGLFFDPTIVQQPQPIPSFITSLRMANKPFHNSTTLKGLTM